MPAGAFNVNDKRKTKEQLLAEIRDLKKAVSQQTSPDYPEDSVHNSTYYKALLKYSEDFILVCDKNGFPVLFK